MPAIRPIALAVPRQGEDLLVFECLDPTKNQNFYLPLGRSIDFGERAETSVRRELRRSSAVNFSMFIGCERWSIFTGFGRDGHPITFNFGSGCHCGPSAFLSYPPSRFGT